MNRGLSLYIHWPFCLSKCPYCDFNSHVSKAPVDDGRWTQALLAEMSYFAAETRGKRLKTIFFGGGTPSTMAPETTALLIEVARSLWTPCEDPEITLEANPTSVEADKLKGFAGAGVNRLSLGVQSFDDEALKFLGRGHSAKEAKAAIALAQETFERCSFDLVYGLPEQSLGIWKIELNQALELAEGHLSLYQLSVEKGTRFYRDQIPEATPDKGADLFDLTHELTALAGLNAYEISNHARPGHECRHNIEIWRGGNYIGIGPGAHGRQSDTEGTDALYQIGDPARWLEKIEKEGHGTSRRTRLSPDERTEEIIMTGLRLTEGISNSRFQALTGRSLGDALDSVALNRLTGAGFLVFDDAGLRTTNKGRLCLNAVLGELLNY